MSDSTKGTPMATKSFDTINYEVDGHTATITLNRPDALNALSPHMITELRAAYDEAENDDNVWLLIVTGTGRAFCTGADVKADPRRRQGHLRAAVPVDLRPVGGAAGGHAAVSHDGQAGAGRDQRHLLRRRTRLGHHRRHRHRIRPGHVLRSARQHRPGRRARDGAAGARRCPATIALRMALMGKHERMSAQRAYELGHDQRGRRARPPAGAGPRDRRHRQLAMRRWRSGAPGWPSARAWTCRCTRPRSSPRRSASGSCAPRTRAKARRAFVEKREPNWQCR